MSAAARAPPPPPPPPSPPPPPPWRGIDSLPTELFLDIIQYLRPEDYASLALAIYPVLGWHGLAPPITDIFFNRIANSHTMPTMSVGTWPLPTELTDMVLHYLAPTDIIALLFSNRNLLERYVPIMPPETRVLLRRWMILWR
ncbi:hypothetical protein GQ43DRAFT_379847 [Delitschia confertaspora ATCC 74209]|uniref:F-box domain-containing protein n=1 Tax=Delitschia confertaspora ATCC 74209 TaxID=1513339 RepID=A0A9P4JH79_9PLEO|nr:hypothetical protein GQ43DRAFT_379847 [Delitschia confertaspora ATCC 74209]